MTKAVSYINIRVCIHPRPKLDCTYRIFTEGSLWNTWVAFERFGWRRTAFKRERGEWDLRGCVQRQRRFKAGFEGERMTVMWVCMNEQNCLAGAQLCTRERANKRKHTHKQKHMDTHWRKKIPSLKTDRISFPLKTQFILNYTSMLLEIALRITMIWISSARLKVPVYRAVDWPERTPKRFIKQNETY